MAEKSTEDQLNEWLKGNSIHNSDRDECCPDFSCCNGTIAPLDVRERFVRAHREGDEKTTFSMLMLFLGEALSEFKDDVYIAGEEPHQTH